MSIWRRASASMAWPMKRIELTFLISQRVPKRLAGLAHRDVDVGAQVALLHVAVAGAEIAQDGAQLGHVGLGLLGRAHVGLGHDLHQRHARAVEIDEGEFGVLVVDRLAGVLLQVQPLDADLAASRRRRRPRPRPRRRSGSCTARSDSPAAGRDRSSSCGRTPRRRLILAFRPSPVRTAWATQASLITGSMPGMAASTSETWLLGSPPNSVEAPENSLALEATWACTSRPITTSQSPVAPLMRSLAGALFCMTRDLLSWDLRSLPCTRATQARGSSFGALAAACFQPGAWQVCAVEGQKIGICSPIFA